jgi:hypothetical protein
VADHGRRDEERRVVERPVGQERLLPVAEDVGARPLLVIGPPADSSAVGVDPALTTAGSIPTARSDAAAAPNSRISSSAAAMRSDRPAYE